MRHFRAAIVPVLAIEGLLMARFADSIRTRMATAVGKAPMRLRDRSRRYAARRCGRLGFPLASLAHFSGGVTSGRTDGRM